MNSAGKPLIFVDATGGKMIQLPPSTKSGQMFLIFDYLGVANNMGNIITIFPFPGDAIDGKGMIELTQSFSAITLVSTGSGSWAITSFLAP
jgi:hypothetical protein